MTTHIAQELSAELLEKWGHDSSRLLQILIGLQQALNHIPADAVQFLATELSLPRAGVEGVISFYSFLHQEPRGDYDILISDNIVDQMIGSREQAGQLAERLGVEPGTINKELNLSLDYTSCTGMSDQGPAALINGYALTRLTPERIDEIATYIKESLPLRKWPRELFQVDENIQRRDLLLDNELPQGAALHAFQDRGAQRLLDELDASGLRGRGGAGFKTAMKWRFCRDAETAQSDANDSSDQVERDRVVVCNADEGEPGTFKDRLLLQAYADRLFEGMTLCSAIIGASQGFLYLRGEYRYLLEPLEQELQKRRDAGLLGNNILGQDGLDFDIEIHLGAGAYICGEESALIESLEGKRGVPRIRPPFPVTHGYLGRPTVVNNVETFIAAAMIADRGPDWFRSRGTEASSGTKLLSISGDCERPGIYEYPFGVSIQTILDDCGAANTQAVQVAGAAGVTLAPDEFGRSIAFEDVPTGGSFMIFDNSRNMLDVVHNFVAFFAHESCGFCTPCRVGNPLLKKGLEKVLVGHATVMDIEKMLEIGTLMKSASHCGLGVTAPNPVLDTLARFRPIYDEHLRSTSFEPAFDLDAALEEARNITGRNDPGAHIKGGGV
jgi:[NiFe] hydrogenase diaphorase moiety large subunit